MQGSLRSKKINYILKYVALGTLVIQTTTLVLVLRYSRTVPTIGPRYVSSTAIVTSEILKICIAVGVIFKQSGWSLSKLLQTLFIEILKKPTETLKLFVPAGLYVIQNNLLFLALSNLDAATYQVTYQLKILTTALFSVTMLHKKLEISQWLSLALLMIGVALVQWPDENAKPVEEIEGSSYTVGLAAILAACFSSGFSGVYLQKILHGSSQSLWIRTVQLGIFSLFLSLGAVLIQDFNQVVAGGFFQGYNSIAWCVILLQAFGGIVIATVMKYADNILKGFATSVSVVLSTLISYYYFKDIILTRLYVIGATVVILATLLYSWQPKRTQTKS